MLFFSSATITYHGYEHWMWQNLIHQGTSWVFFLQAVQNTQVLKPYDSQYIGPHLRNENVTSRENIIPDLSLGALHLIRWEWLNDRQLLTDVLLADIPVWTGCIISSVSWYTCGQAASFPLLADIPVWTGCIISSVSWYTCVDRLHHFLC